MVAAMVVPGPALAQGGPLSAIDWLSETLRAQPDLVHPDEPGTSAGAGTETIAVTPLGEVSNDAVGLLPAAVSGLPADLWGNSPSAELAGLFDRLHEGLLPAPRDLLLTMLLAELDPPADSDPGHDLFHARIDTLVDLGAVDQAHALLERAGPDDPESFARYFDTSLLLGAEDTACTRLVAAPGLAPGLAARIFCLARTGDWGAAALTLETGRALGDLSGAEDAILARYLDPETFEGVPDLAPPSRPSPLVFRLYEAIAEPIPTNLLPLPFAQADLQLNTGWKAQIEAAERLARSGVLDANRLLGLYTDRQPAASGGVWDRVAAIQQFDAALDGGASPELETALSRAWTVLAAADLEPVFARLYGRRLQGLALTGEAARIAFEVGLLSDAYELAATARQPEDDRERFLRAVARGDLAGAPTPGPVARAIASGFLAAGPPERLAELVRGGNLGEAILRALIMSQGAAGGDTAKLQGAIALLRAVRLEDVARRLALQAMILGGDA